MKIFAGETECDIFNFSDHMLTKIHQRVIVLWYYSPKVHCVTCIERKLTKENCKKRKKLKRELKDKIYFRK